MKRLWALVLAGIIILTLVACSKEGAPPERESAFISTIETPERTSAPGSERAEEAGEKLTREELDALCVGGELLTEQLVGYAFNREIIDEGAALSKREIEIFMLGLAGYLDRPEHPYCDFISVTPEKIYIFPVENLRRIARELFGAADFAFSDGLSITLNEEKQQYESGLEFGIGGGYSCKNLKAKALLDGSGVEVEFLLTDNAGFEGEEGWNEYGYYKTTYSIISEGGKEYLRYLSTEQKTAQAEPLAPMDSE